MTHQPERLPHCTAFCRFQAGKSASRHVERASLGGTAPAPLSQRAQVYYHLWTGRIGTLGILLPGARSIYPLDQTVACILISLCPSLTSQTFRFRI